METRVRRPLLLAILDGWGEGPDWEYNALTRSGLENYPRWLASCPRRTIACSGEAVGLPDGQMGNSEVGHLTLGAGRVVFQELPRISREIAAGAFFENPVLREACASAGGATLHLLGLVSDGGVHSHLEHLKALLLLAKREGVSRVAVHALLDGRDTPPDSGAAHVGEIQSFLQEKRAGAIATVMGRYYGMDRDQRWERTERAYRALVHGEGTRASDPVEAVRSSYAAGVTDEFVAPVILDVPFGRIRDGDSVICFNFRADRMRQIVKALAEPGFDGFPRSNAPSLSRLATFTKYHSEFPFPVAFETAQPRMTLGEVVSTSGLTQLRIAETEKYAHVTFFFNGGREVPFEGEERLLIPSPKVPTYDQKPEMSALEVTEALLGRFSSAPPDFTLLNFANPDMVGHTGDFAAACRAARAVDSCMGRIAERVLELGGAVCLTADHGNLEAMREPDGTHPHTAHTTNPVNLIWLGEAPRELEREGERGLASVAPTLLEWMGLPVPPEMDAPSLWKRGFTAEAPRHRGRKRLR